MKHHGLGDLSVTNKTKQTMLLRGMKHHGLGDLNMINKTKPNYLALWHETPWFGRSQHDKQNKTKLPCFIDRS
jgi:hypothetical protein